MAHIGQKVAFQLGRSLQEVGSVVEFRVECHNSAIGLVQFPVQLREFQLARAQFV